MRAAKVWIVVACFCSLAFSARPAQSADQELLKAVLVIVNGHRITRDDLNHMAQFLLLRRYGDIDLSTIQMSPEEVDDLSAAAMRELVRMQLILDEAEVLNLRAADTDVMEKLNRFGVNPERTPAVGRRRAEAEVLIDEIFKHYDINMGLATPAEMREIYKKEKDTAFTTDSFVRVRHFMIPISTVTDSDRAVKSVERLRKEIMAEPPEKRSALFAEKAKSLSDDAFAKYGGLLRISPDPEGWFRQDFGNMRPNGGKVFPDVLYKAIQALRHDDRHNVSKVIRSEQGVHLLFLEDIKGGKTMSWEEALPIIRRWVETHRRQERIDKWLRGKVANSRITWHDGTPYPVEEIFAASDKDDSPRTTH